VIGAPREQIWGVLSDIANAKRWNRGWSAVEFATNQTHGTGTRFRARTADGDSFDFEISAWVAPEYIEFSPVREEPEHYGIMMDAQAFQLKPAGEGATRVELMARASTHGVKGRLVGLLFWRGHQKQGLAYALEMLASLFERERREEPEGDVTPTTD
jgi:uncharacterized protein YndB with AHSA1/START domain